MPTIDDTQARRDNGGGLHTDRLREGLERVREKSNEWGRIVREFVQDRPATALAIAVGAGYLFGKLLRRL